MSTQIENRWLSYAEACKYLGVSLATMRRLCDEGHAIAFRVGERLVRFDREQLDSYVSGQRLIDAQSADGGD